MKYMHKNNIVSTSLALSDLVSFAISVGLVLGIHALCTTDFNHTLLMTQLEGWFTLHAIVVLGCVGWYSVRLRHYFYRKTFWFELKEILRTLVIFSVFETSIIAFTDWLFPSVIWASIWIVTFILLPTLRMTTKRLLDIVGLWRRETWILGSGKNAVEAFNAVSSERNLGLSVIGFIAGEANSQQVSAIAGIPVINPDAEWLALQDKKTQFIVAVEANQADLRNAWLRNFMIKGYRYVSVIPTLRGMPLDSTDMSFIFSHEVMIFRVQQNLAKVSSRVLKRIFDIFGSLAIIVMLSPVLIYISRKVKKDGGPAIYGHVRVGKNGKSFKCLKFRSMVINSKEVLTDILANDPEARAEWDLNFKLRNDPRVTKIGAFLRHTSLDELPQLFNVLKGEMSLVGPRPIITEELERYNDEVGYYLLSKPGMTGLWQVSGRSDVDYETRIYFDVWYVKNWSIWNDIAILFKTVSVVIKKDGAY